jgi:hypothetical protein
MRLTGMEGKLNQYAAGERFIAAVEAARGPRAIDVCWTSPAMLPSIDEIRDPQRWLRRIGQRGAERARSTTWPASGLQEFRTAPTWSDAR